jgi:hypothetical protein
MAFVGNSVVAAWERGLSTLRERARNKNLTFLLALPFPLSPSRRMLSVIYSLVLVSGLIMGSTITVPLVWDSWRYLKGSVPCLYLYEFLYMYACVYACVSVCLCVCVCACVRACM